MSHAAFFTSALGRRLPKCFYIAERRRKYSNVRNMFLHKWTVQLSRPGQIVQRAFDSEEEVVAYVRRMEREPRNGVRAAISVIDPEGKEKLVAPVEAVDTRQPSPIRSKPWKGLPAASASS